MNVDICREDYSFSDLRAVFDEEVNLKNESGTIFPQHENEVENRLNVAKVLAERMPHILGSIDEQEKPI